MMDSGEVLSAELLGYAAIGSSGNDHVLLCYSDNLSPYLDSLGFQDLMKRVVRPRYYGMSSLVVDKPIASRPFGHHLVNHITLSLSCLTSISCLYKGFIVTHHICLCRGHNDHSLLGWRLISDELCTCKGVSIVQGL